MTNSREHNYEWAKVWHLALIEADYRLMPCSDGTAWVLSYIFRLLAKGLEADIEQYEREKAAGEL